MIPAHPFIECIVQKQIRKCGANDTTLGCSLVPMFLGSIFQLSWSFQPPLHVEQNPFAVRMPAHRPEHQLVIDVVEKAPDIQI